MTKRTYNAFTLVELLVVIAIISVLAAILAPVCSQVRAKSYQIACISTQKQLGLGILLYAQDYDEMLPNGMNFAHGQQMWAGEGWAGQCFQYVRSTGVYHCTSDITPAANGLTAVSYGYNYNLVNGDDYPYGDIATGMSLSELTSSSRSVMLFEVAGVPVSLGHPREGDSSEDVVSYFSASGNGLDNRLYAHKDWTTGIDNTYATGYLGGRQPFNPAATQFPNPYGRHAEGSNFLLCDGHARWIRGPNVSSGLNALGEFCVQDNVTNVPGCGGQFYAAGTGADGGVQATFATH